MSGSKSKITFSMEESVTTPTSRNPSQRKSPSRVSPSRASKAPSPQKSSRSHSTKTPEVSVLTEPSGDVHVTVKVSELKPHKKKCKRGQSSPVMDSSSGYLLPPENITPSQKLLLDALQIQVNRKALSEELKSYINQLMSMSRGSIDRLYESDYTDVARNSPERNVDEDILELSRLTGEYAEQVNTLVDILDQIEPPRQSPSPVRVPHVATPYPSKIPRPTHTQSPVPSPFMQQGSGRGPRQLGEPPCKPCSGASPTGRPTSRGPSPSGRPDSRGPSPSGRPTSRGSSPSERLNSRDPSPSSAPRTAPLSQEIPLKPKTPPMRRKTRPITPIPTKVVGPPPGSNLSKIPISPQYQPQRPVPTGIDDIQLPFRISANLLPHPDDLPPMVPRGQKPITAGFIPGGSPIQESAEIHSPCSPPQIPVGFRGSPQQSPTGAGCPDTQFANVFGDQQLGDEFGDQQFNEDDGGDWDNVNQLLEESAASSGHVTYPEDFPPRTDVFGQGFNWDAANLTEPGWPKSFPGQPLRGSALSVRDNIQIDSSFNTSAVAYPVNIEKINEIRAKLSRICNDQYREVIELLQQDQANDLNEYQNLLKRVRSDPFQDPNATLAPISHVAPGSSRSTSSGSSPANKNTINNIEAMNILASSIKNKTASPKSEYSSPQINFEEVD